MFQQQQRKKNTEKKSDVKERKCENFSYQLIILIVNQTYSIQKNLNSPTHIHKAELRLEILVDFVFCHA